MKKHNILKVVLLTILVVVLCTWIFPSASFDNSLYTLTEGERAQAGLFDVFAYPMVAVMYFGNILLYTLAVGAFYGVLSRIPAYEKLVDRIVSQFRGLESLFLGLVVVLIAAIVSVTGMMVPILFLFPFIISVVLKMGYNKLVAATVTVGPTLAGVSGTTLGVMTTGYMNQLLAITSFDEMVSKLIVLCVYVVLLIAFLVLYGKKTRNVVVETMNTEKEDQKSLSNEKYEQTKLEIASDSKKVDASKKEKDATSSQKSTKSKDSTKKNATKGSNNQKTSSGKRGRPAKNRASMAKDSAETLVIRANSKKKVHVWPLVIIFDLVLIILGLSVFDWNGLFEITWFTDATKSVLTYAPIADFPIFGKLLGTVGAFGEWSLNIEITAFILIATCIVGLVYAVKWSDFIDGICDGVKKAFGPGLIMLLTYVVLVLTTYHPFQLCITKFLLDLTSGINVVTMSVIAMFASFFNVDMVYVAQSTLPYVQTIITDTTLYPLIGLIFQAMYGLILLIAPTSFLLMGTLTYLDIPYTQWIKHIWKFFLVLLAVLVVIFLIVLAL